MEIRITSALDLFVTLFNVNDQNDTVLKMILLIVFNFQLFRLITIFHSSLYIQSIHTVRVQYNILTQLIHIPYKFWRCSSVYTLPHVLLRIIIIITITVQTHCTYLLLKEGILITICSAVNLMYREKLCTLCYNKIWWVYLLSLISKIQLIIII